MIRELLSIKASSKMSCDWFTCNLHCPQWKRHSEAPAAVAWQCSSDHARMRTSALLSHPEGTQNAALVMDAKKLSKQKCYSMIHRIDNKT